MVSAVTLTGIVAVLFKIGSVASETKQWRFTDVSNKIWMLRATLETGPNLLYYSNAFYILLIILFATRLAKVKRDDLYLLIFLGVLYAICPFGLELVMNLDGRIVPIALAFLVAFSVWRGCKSKGAEMAVVSVCFAFSLASLFPIYKQVQGGNVEGEKVREMAKTLDPGSLLVTVDMNADMAFERASWDPGLRMISYYAMCEKSLAMPGIYMFPTQQPITVKPGNPILDFVAPEGGGKPDVDQIEQSLDMMERSLAKSHSFGGKPVYVLLINHRRTGFPQTYRLKYLGQDQCVALARVEGIFPRKRG